MAGNLDVIETALQKFLVKAPHLNEVEVGVYPTTNSPVGVLSFDWPQDSEFATRIVEVTYLYTFDIYVPSDNSYRAHKMIQDVVLDIRKRKLEQEVEANLLGLNGLVERMFWENGGRPFPVESNLVKSTRIGVRAEEGI
jgi:hypothetical protein